ncbi:10568_t:CDS:2, partial [Dentiscutata heterogama]
MPHKFDNRHNIGVEDQKTTGNEVNRQVVSKPLVPIVENKNIPYSIEKCQSKRIQNNKCKDSNLNEKSGKNVPPSQRRKIKNFALKDLFNEQEINWNQKEFVK